MNCASCGSFNEDYSTECWFCGTAIKPTKKKPREEPPRTVRRRHISEMEDDPGPLTIDDARKLAEQLKPAFAGYLSDGEISRKDVLGTLMDLIVRGYIGLDAETQKKPQLIKKIYEAKGTTSLLPFEKEFVNVLFDGKNQLSKDEASRKLNSGELEKVIKNNLSVISDNDIAKTSVLLFDETGYETTDLYWRRVIEEVKTFGQLESHYNKVHADALQYGIYGLLGVFILIFFITQDASISDVPFEILSAPITLFFGVLSVLAVLDFKKLKPFMELQFKGNIMPRMKNKYADLFDFIHDLPMAEQRLHNEFLPFAVAFGLDTSWNLSFAVPIETAYNPLRVSLKRFKAKEVEKKEKTSQFDWEYECTRCSTISPKDATVCSKCGAPLGTMTRL